MSLLLPSVLRLSHFPGFASSCRIFEYLLSEMRRIQRLKLGIKAHSRYLSCFNFCLVHRLVAFFTRFIKLSKEMQRKRFQYMA